MKLPRTIRLETSDRFIFPSATALGEWAIAGAFVFFAVQLATLEGKDLSAFRSGFLGVLSLGWSTLVQIVEADETDRSAAAGLVARCLLESFGAPDRAAARKVAEEEIDFAASLCDRPLGTLIAVHRTRESGTTRETFRSLRPRGGPKGRRVFSFLDAEVDGEPVETVSLATLARGERG